MPINRNAVENAIRALIDPYLHEDWVTANAVHRIDCSDSKAIIDIRLAYPVKKLAVGYQELLLSQLENIATPDQFLINFSSDIKAHQTQKDLAPLPHVKNIIAVASGKGGVGKSTTAVNLALALSQEGANVGILDADIYGPSLGMMLGIPEGERPDVREQKYFVPIKAHGIQVISMAVLTTEKTPMVWRGPMVSGALLQLATQTLWEDLDYLIVDLPPGTGDIHLTLAQRIPLVGAVIVTTPQDIALLDAKKGIEMFRKVDVAVLGIIENMSLYICPQCGHESSLFGRGGGERIAEQYQTTLLGNIPLDISIREQTDQGKPTVIAEPDSMITRHYIEAARKLAASVAKLPAIKESNVILKV